MWDRYLIVRLLCVGLVAAVMVPLGGILFPYVSNAVDGMQFQALEAVFSAAVGYGLSVLLV
jgi:hypothetical protein